LLVERLSDELPPGIKRLGRGQLPAHKHYLSC
jgi:hypothetical protein